MCCGPPILRPTSPASASSASLTSRSVDRGDPPLGNTVNRAPLDKGANGRPAPEFIFRHLMEGIGIALDRKGDRTFMTDLAGSAYCASLDGSKPSVLLFARAISAGSHTPVSLRTFELAACEE